MKHIKYFLEYLTFIILKTFLLVLGFDRACRFCVYCVRKLAPFLPATKTAKNNLRKTLGDKDVDRYLNDLLENYGRYIAEFVYLNHLPQAELDQRVEIQGLEKIEDLQKNNQPFLLCLGHLGNWDFLIRSINKLYPKFSIIYRKINNPYIDKYVLDSREIKPNIVTDGNSKQSKNITEEPFVQMIAKGPSGARKLVTAIKQKHSIAMLVDQKMNDGIEVPFFDMPAMTANAIAKLSMQYNYPIVPVQIVRVKDSYFKAIIHSPLDKKSICSDSQMQDKEDDYKIMLHINKIIEGWIRQNPGQWFWFHNRWKK